MTWRFGIRTKVFAVSLALVALVGLATAPLLEAQLRDRRIGLAPAPERGSVFWLELPAAE